VCRARDPSAGAHRRRCEHFIDGGIVNSIPVSRAVTLGARTIYVLQVGRLEQSLKPPRWPWEVGLVAFEVARRHRFAHDLSSLPKDLELHTLPTGGSQAPAYNDVSGQLRVRQIARAIERQMMRPRCVTWSGRDRARCHPAASDRDGMADRFGCVRARVSAPARRGPG
jgi:predicted acylesterase/phospholipase RssA